MTNCVLFIASLSERYYYDAFVDACTKIGVEVYILDPEYFVESDAQISVLIESGQISGSIEVIHLTKGGHTSKVIDIVRIKVVWYLRVDRTQYVSDIQDEAKRFKWSETLSLLNSLLSTIECIWVNTRESIELHASNKLFQQICANRVGISTPDTIVTNDPGVATSFCQVNDSTLLCKTIGYTRLGDDDSGVIYSEIFTYDELSESHDAIKECPVFCQEYVQKKYEYRVMLIGDAVLACRIDSQSSEKTRIDWRHYDFENVEHQYVTLPEDLQVKLRLLMKECQLGYGAVDLIEDKEGNFVFLEINPSGQWEWIEKLARLPVADSVAKYLLQSLSK